MSRLVVLDDPGAAPGLSGDVVAELRQLFPAASVAHPPSGTPVIGQPGDLVVVVFGAAFRTPLEDVIYDHLGRLTSLARTLGRDGHVLLYRVWWREVEVIASSALPRRLRRLRLERWLIRALRAVQAHRWLLRPRYHGN